MDKQKLISVETLCAHYKVEMTFMYALENFGLIEIQIVDQSLYVNEEKINEIERALRLHHELEINLEGVDVIINLLQKIDELQNELEITRNKLRIFEE